MIHKLLMAYLVKKPEKHLSSVHWAYITSILGFVIVIIAFLFIDLNQTVELVVELAAVVATLFIFSIFEKKLNKMWRTDYKEYNNKLDIIRTILSDEMTYLIGEDTSGWYSERKIDHLIEEGNKWIADQEERKKKNENFAHIAVLPVIAFIAEILKDSISPDAAVVTGVLLLIVVLIVYCTDRLFSMIVDSIIKTASVDQMELLISLLKDLKIRDFAD